MARNTLTDLNNHLFAQLERLNDEDMTPEQIADEVKRAKAVGGIANNIINNARVSLDAMKYTSEQLELGNQVPEQFRIKE